MKRILFYMLVMISLGTAYAQQVGYGSFFSQWDAFTIRDTVDVDSVVAADTADQIVTMPNIYDLYIFEAEIVGGDDSGFVARFDADSAEIIFYYETSVNGSDWSKVTSITPASIGIPVVQYRPFVPAGNANDTLFGIYYRCIARMKTTDGDIAATVATSPATDSAFVRASITARPN